jgi:hypothetical protein
MHFMQQKRLAFLLALLSTLCMVETAGRAFPCFRHGTDYILNLCCLQVPRRLMRNIIFYLEVRISHPSTTILKWQPISRYTAVGLLHIPLGIALSLIYAT